MWLKSAIFALFFVSTAFAADQAYGNRPRGVPADKASLYEERDQFKCLDGSKSIPFSQVNDDYCDCVDGSDEPGTSACSNGRFHCRNYGYKAHDIPSSRVNDQICDSLLCCDGSDEWDSGIECPNVCQELGAQARKDLDQHRDLVEKGYARRVELAKEGAKSMEEKKAELEKMKKELDDLQPVKAGIEASKNQAEEKESVAKGEEDRKWNEIVEKKRKDESAGYFQKVDTDKNEKITIDEFKQAIKEATGADANDDDVKAAFLDDTEIDAQRFLDHHDSIVRLLKPRPKQPEPEEPTTPAPNSASELDEEEEELKDDQLEPEETAHEDEGEQDGGDQKPDYTDETKKLIEEANKYRDQLRDTSNKIRDLEADIRDAENFLQAEYGPDFAWAPLKGQCPEINQAQYTYRLCLFDRAIQKDKNGHHEIGLGNWKGWEGPDDDKYSKQKYADGQHCWNGPARSTLVHVECGLALELYDVKEPAKCEYEFKMRSPAACPDPATIKDPFAVHTEL